VPAATGQVKPFLQASVCGIGKGTGTPAIIP